MSSNVHSRYPFPVLLPSITIVPHNASTPPRSILLSYFAILSSFYLKSRLITIPYVPCTIFSCHPVRSFQNSWFCYIHYSVFQSKRNRFITHETPDTSFHSIHQHSTLSFVFILSFSLNKIQSTLYC